MMGKKYGRLTLNERFEIEKLLSHKKSSTDISLVLHRSKSTVCREVNKQGREAYKALEGERLAVSSVRNRRSGKTNQRKQQWIDKRLFSCGHRLQHYLNSPFKRGTKPAK